MLPEFKRKTNWGVGLGLLMQLAGKVLQSSDESGLVEIGEILAIFGFVPLIWGCVQYAKGKGLSPYFGALGLFWIVGLVVLVLLPDKHKTVEAPDA
jgi:hypothetical protein